ncbi:hypothetical protein [Photobacterium sp.]|uniref:hypothetical protein n=1 Tax=Photobacterium sp. TaxID=660 RepID=UPI00299D029B|nr:hypothetical protein [Photobacterium sp.]MDX1303123.1 hypothetical protein [Photobacterium sp.]
MLTYFYLDIEGIDSLYSQIADIGIAGLTADSEQPTLKATSYLTTEQKLATVLKVLRLKGKLFASLDDALEQAKQAEGEPEPLYFEFVENCLIPGRKEFESADEFFTYIHYKQIIGFTFERHPDVAMTGDLYKFEHANREETRGILSPHLQLIMSSGEVKMKGFGVLHSMPCYVKPFYLSGI